MTAVRILRLAAGGDGVGKLDGRPHRVRPAHRAGRPGRARRPPRPQAFRPCPGRPRWSSRRPTEWPALSALRARRMRRMPAPASATRAPSARRVAGSWATPSAAWLGGTCPIRRSCQRPRVRLPHQDHPRGERRRPADRAASLRSRRPGVRAGVVPHHRARADGAVAGPPASAPAAATAVAIGRPASGSQRRAPRRVPDCGG